MSVGERWVLRLIALSLVAFWIVLAIGHIPRGG
jgi:hypothetical protein